MRRRRSAAGLAAAVLFTLALASPTAAESALWTLTASPLTATTGVARTFTLTATNTDPLALALSSAEIGCLWVDVPGNFAVSAATVTGSNAGGGWHVDSVTANRVVVHTDSGGERLALLDWVRFTVTAMPLNTGSLTWKARAYRAQDCSGTGALLGVPPVVLVTGAAVTPTPAPTPTLAPPPPPPTPSPTPVATPRLSTPRPSATPRPTATTQPIGTPGMTATPRASVPTSGTASPTASPSAGAQETEPSGTANGSVAPAPSGTPTASPTPGAGAGTRAPDPSPPSRAPGQPTAPGSNPGGGGTGDPATPPPVGTVPSVDEASLDLGAIGILGGAIVWFVPTAVLGVPGLLVLLWVAAQTAGGLVWVPAIRRLRVEDRATGRAIGSLR